MHHAVMGQSPPEDEVILTAEMMQYWSNFAKTGNPNSGNLVG